VTDIDLGAFMGGIGVALSVFFVAALLVSGALIIRRVTGS